MWKPFSRKPPKQEGRKGPLLPHGEGAGDPDPTSRAPERIAEIEVIGQIVVATITVEELSTECGIEQLANLLVDLEETGAKHFILDIQNVQFMDSGCLGCLVESLNRLAAHGGKIALANTAHRVQYLFKLTRLDRVFHICSDVITAMKVVEREAA